MASLILYATNFECRNSSENTTESTEKVRVLSRYSVQSIFITSSYTSSAVLALKCLIGWSMRMAVCNCMLALYIISLLPTKEAMRRDSDKYAEEHEHDDDKPDTIDDLMKEDDKSAEDEKSDKDASSDGKKDKK